MDADLVRLNPEVHLYSPGCKRMENAAKAFAALLCGLKTNITSINLSQSKDEKDSH